MLVLQVAAALITAELVAAYSFNFENTPQQCGNVSIALTGSDGTPPFRVLIVPIGPSPLQKEVRLIMEQPFNGNDRNVSFKLPYPANAQFIAVVSDSATFGSGGTTVPAQVTSSSDSSCFDSSKDVQPQFFFFVTPDKQVSQCTQTNISWDQNAQGPVKTLGVIPGGQSFVIPQTNVQNRSFNWTANVKAGTTLLIVAGDSRASGNGGSWPYFVGQGSSDCLDAASPSSTPGSPAGGSYPTNANGGTTMGGGGSGGKKTNVGAIVGGVIGGLIFLAAIGILAFVLLRRKRKQRRVIGEKPDLVGDGEQHDAPGQLPQFYEPQPFIVPEATSTSHRTSTGVSDLLSPGRHSETVSDSDPTRLSTESGAGGPGPSGASTTTGTSRKTGLPPLRPVNIIQHDDAGTVDRVNEEPTETVELPPAYTNLRK